MPNRGDDITADKTGTIRVCIIKVPAHPLCYIRYPRQLTTIDGHRLEERPVRRGEVADSRPDDGFVDTGSPLINSFPSTSMLLIPSFPCPMSVPLPACPVLSSAYTVAGTDSPSPATSAAMTPIPIIFPSLMCHVFLLADCMDCIANCIFDFSSYSSFIDGFPFPVLLIVSPCSPSCVPLFRFVTPSRLAIVVSPLVPPLAPLCLPSHLSDAPSPRLLLAAFRLPFAWRIPVSSVPHLSPPLLADGRGAAIVRGIAMTVRIVFM